MKKYSLLFFVLFFSIPAVFADGNEAKSSQAGNHTPHPPHDHHEPHHLKYLKDSDHRRKRHHQDTMREKL